MKYAIRRKMIDEKNNLVFLLSVVNTMTGTSAIWSTHKYEGDPKASTQYLAQIYQAEHDRQIDFIIVQEFLNEPEEFRDKTNILDLTQEQ